MKKFWEVKNAANQVGEVYIYGDITSYKWDDSDTTAQSFKEDLDSLGDINTLNLYINSPGGSVFQGQAIYSIIKRHKAYVKAYIDGLAASIASLIPMAADEIHMPANAMMMIHNPWTFAWGNAGEFRKQADDLDKIRESMIETYLNKAGDKLQRDKLIEMLDAETWLTAKECQEYGLCDHVEAEKQVAASVNIELFSKYKNAPKSLMELAQKEPQNKNLEKEIRQQLIAESQTNITKLNQYLGGI